MLFICFLNNGYASSNSYIDTSIPTNLITLNTPFSITFLTNITEPSLSSGADLICGINADGVVFTIYREKGGNQKLIFGNNTPGEFAWITTVNDIIINQINHIVLTYNGVVSTDINNYTLYVNGEIEPITTYTSALLIPSISIDTLRLGNNQDVANKFLDEFTLHNDALTLQEVIASHTASIKGNRGQWIQKDTTYPGQRNITADQIDFPTPTILDEEYTDDNSVIWVATNLAPPIWGRQGLTTGASNFLELTDTPTDYAGKEGYIVSVNNTPDSLEYIYKHEFINLLDTPAGYQASIGKALVVNQLGNGIEFITMPDAGVNAFVDLTDTPNDYTGQAGKTLVVNQSSSGLEYSVPATGVSLFSDLADTPVDYTNGAGKTLVVNQAGDGIEYINEPYDFAFFIAGTLDTNSLVGSVILTRNVKIVANPTFQSYAMTAPSNLTITFDIIHNDQQSTSVVGELAFANGSNVATLNWPSDVNFLPGDLIQAKTRSDVDDISDISFTIVGLTV